MLEVGPAWLSYLIPDVSLCMEWMCRIKATEPGAYFWHHYYEIKIIMSIHGTSIMAYINSCMNVGLVCPLAT